MRTQNARRLVATGTHPAEPCQALPASILHEEHQRPKMRLLSAQSCAETGTPPNARNQEQTKKTLAGRSFSKTWSFPDGCSPVQKAKIPNLNMPSLKMPSPSETNSLTTKMSQDARSPKLKRLSPPEQHRTQKIRHRVLHTIVATVMSPSARNPILTMTRRDAQKTSMKPRTPSL
jgi:hypothetical protein